MKHLILKNIALLLSIVILISCCLPLTVHAEEAKTLLDVLAENSADEREALSDTSLYVEPMSTDLIDDEPLLSVPCDIYWELSDETAEYKLNYSQHIYNCSYVAFGDPVIRFTRHNNEYVNITGIAITYDELPTHLSDIQRGSARQTFCGTECNIEDVVCFDSGTNYTGIAVYYITDQGTFVRYYDYDNSNTYIEFSEDEFKEYGAQYYEYLCNYGTEGETIVGETLSFSDFVEHELWKEPLPSVSSPEKANIFLDYLALWIAIPSVAIVGVTAFLVVRKKRKKAAPSQ